jgi:hypothetical protein
MTDRKAAWISGVSLVLGLVAAAAILGNSAQQVITVYSTKDDACR